jgi:hypothetical protein
VIQAASAKDEAETTVVIAAMKCGRNTVKAIFLEMVTGRVGHKTSKCYRLTAMSGQRKTAS